MLALRLKQELFSMVIHKYVVLFTYSLLFVSSKHGYKHCHTITMVCYPSFVEEEGICM